VGTFISDNTANVVSEVLVEEEEEEEEGNILSLNKGKEGAEEEKEEEEGNILSLNKGKEGAEDPTFTRVPAPAPAFAFTPEEEEEHCSLFDELEDAEEGGGLGSSDRAGDDR
jgi:hypothetical protein